MSHSLEDPFTGAYLATRQPTGGTVGPVGYGTQLGEGLKTPTPEPQPGGVFVQ